MTRGAPDERGASSPGALRSGPPVLLRAAQSGTSTAEEETMSKTTPEKKIRVRVAANPERGFFRCGRHWTRSQKEAEVTEDELKILMGERKLSVVVVPEGTDEPSGKPDPKAEAAAGGKPDPKVTPAK